MAKKRFQQGYYTPKYPDKYVGNVAKIRYMSSWELHMFEFLDGNSNVLQWSSEEIAISYIKPTDGLIHKYYPDLFISYRNKKGEVKWELIEIKPASQTKAPRSNSKHALYEQVTYAINVCKWQAAIEWCKRESILSGKEITFRIVTEKGLFA